MSIAVISLVSLVLVILISCITQRLNPGLLALLAAVLISTATGYMSVVNITALFPSNLFILLVSMGLVFGTAHQNGTLEKLTQRAFRLIGGRRELLPFLIFFLAFVFSAVGPGNIIATAILAPMAMVLAKRQGMSQLLIAIMLCTGANAGAFSPVAPTGLITIGLLEKMNIQQNLIWVVFGASAVLQSLSALLAYAIHLFRSRRRHANARERSLEKIAVVVEPLSGQQKLTIGLIALLLIGVLVAKLPLILMALCIALVMFALKLSEEDVILKTIPWSTILMVSGIAILIGLMEKTGGLDLATNFLASAATPGTISGFLAFVSGLVSAYSSSSGVVLPAFLPLIPGLAEKMQIANLIPMVIAVAVGSHMVDVSPLSTLGALTLASVDDQQVRRRMFKLLMIWGLSMSIVAGVLAFVFLDLMV